MALGQLHLDGRVITGLIYSACHRCCYNRASSVLTVLELYNLCPVMSWYNYQNGWMTGALIDMWPNGMR